MSDTSKNDPAKTQAYVNSSGSDKTRYYESGIAGTETYAQEDHQQSVTPETRAYEAEESPRTDRTEAHNLGIGDSVELNGKEYEILDIISHEGKTLEAIVYKVKNNEDRIFALKLYYQFRNPKNEPNAEALRRISEITDPDVLKLHDFGTGANKYRKQFCYEICDFATGGDLLAVDDIKKKYNPNFLESHVIPEIFKGIKKLHQHRIIHCDLKPQNVFFLDEQLQDLVIGDYGSAKTFEMDSEKESRRSSMVKGSDFYLAPEQSRGIISDRNDYHSLGMILLHLIYPEQLNKVNFDRIIQRQTDGREIIDFDSDYDRFNQLIAGLTLLNINRRWGKDEVDGWLNGEDIEIRYSSEQDAAPIKLGKVTIHTQADLLQYIEGEDKWYDDLIDDEQGYKLLLDWLSALHDLERKKTFDRMVRYYRLNVAGKDNIRKYVKEAVLRFFEPERPVRVEMKCYDFYGADSPRQIVEQFFQHMDDIWKITRIWDLKYYLFQLEFCLKQLRQAATGELKILTSTIIDKIAAALDVSTDEDFFNLQATLYANITDELLIELFYCFNSGREFKDLSGKSYDTIEKVGFFFAGKQEQYSNKYLSLERAWFLKKHDLNRLFKEKVKNFLFSIFNEHVRAEIEFVSINFARSECTISYKLGKSLSDYFKEHSINKSLVEISKGNDTLILEKLLYSSAGSIFKDYINKIEQKHNVKEEHISPTSKEKFEKNLKENKKKFARDKLKNTFTKFIINQNRFVSATIMFTIILFICFGGYLITYNPHYITEMEKQSAALPNHKVPRKEGIISVSAANIRARPSTAAREIGVLRKGEKISILSLEGNWYKIRMSNSKSGYVYNNLVSLGYGNAATLSSKSSLPSQNVKKIGQTEKAIKQSAQSETGNAPTKSTSAEVATLPIKIQSRPQGATIFVDKQKAGVTPLNIDLAPGSHGVKLVKVGCKTKWDLLRVEKDCQKEFFFQLVRK